MTLGRRSSDVPATTPARISDLSALAKAALGALSVLSAVGGVLGYQRLAPGDQVTPVAVQLEALRATDQRVDAELRRRAEFEVWVIQQLAASIRYTCLKDRAGAEMAGYQCRHTLEEGAPRMPRASTATSAAADVMPLPWRPARPDTATPIVVALPPERVPRVRLRSAS